MNTGQEIYTMQQVMVTERSQIAQARRVAMDAARALGFTLVEQGQVALVATELATNLFIHAIHGFLLICSVTEPDGAAVELLAVDKGPGIADVARCLRDGYSTAGTSGTGLGAVVRCSAEWDIYSQLSSGTAVFARLPSIRQHPLPTRSLTIGVVCLPKPGEEQCGDSWAVRSHAGQEVILVVDGLGHGPAAALAAQAAVQAFAAHAMQAPHAILGAIHSALRGTRGAAVAVATIDRTKDTVHFCGVGNIGGHIMTPRGSYGLVSHNGIVGHQAPKMQEFHYPWASDALLVLFSDGLASRWSWDSYPGLLLHHPSVMAGVLYRDYTRGNDDVTVVVVKDYADTFPSYSR